MIKLSLLLGVLVVLGCQSGQSKSGDPPATGSAAIAPAPKTATPPPGDPIQMAPTPSLAPTEPATTRTDEAYRKDVERVCNVVELAGAAGHDANDKAFLVATWLGKNLETPDAQKWLASIQRVNGNAKADALEQEARRVGLAGCTLANDWRSPTP